MRAKAATGTGVIALATLGSVLAFVLVSPASAHSDPCHSRHSCPSDHHTYVWIDPSTGVGWDCAKPGAGEYSPESDTTTIEWLGRTYHCRAASRVTPTPAPGATHVLPITSITPGAANANVRQSTIRGTICKAGWTATIRPPSAYTSALKRSQMPLYGETGPTSAYEEDHLIPLELGGAPRNRQNLWPEPREQAKESDPLETRLKRQVCDRTITLAAARLAIRAFKFTHG